MTLDIAGHEMPLMISVDDHVMEAPDIWTSRVPKSRARRMFPTSSAPERSARSSTARWCSPGARPRVIPAIGGSTPMPRSLSSPQPLEWDSTNPTSPRRPTIALHPGTWQQAGRLVDMTTDGVEASMCYPNLVSRFCGQTFLERGDRETSLECVRAYNDWMLDEWTAGAGHGRLLPLTLIPLWDVRAGGCRGHSMRR